MEIISISITTNHWKLFVSLCRKADEIVMVSPFCYSDFTAFADAIASSCDSPKVNCVLAIFALNLLPWGEGVFRIIATATLARNLTSGAGREGVNSSTTAYALPQKLLSCY